MSALTGLKLITAQRRNALSTSVYKRKKLVEKLHEQLACIEAQQAGALYRAKRLQRVVNNETGLVNTVEVSKRVREWYWTGENGKLNFAVKYGANTLTLAKGGKNALEVSTAAELIAAIKVLMAAAANGEFDEAIAEVSTKTRKGFGK